MTTRPILVGYDASDGARAAATWALDEAAMTGSPVELAYAYEWPPFVMAPADVTRIWPADQAHRDITAVLDAAVAEAAHTHPGVRVTGLVLQGAPAPLLQDRSRQASLVVLGSRGHGGFAGLLLGSTSVAVSAHAHCPVVVVRGARPGPGTWPGHVVAGVDFSPDSRLALDFAFAQAAGHGVPLHVVRAWTPPASRRHVPDVDVAQITAGERAALDDLLAGWKAAYPDVPVTCEVAADAPGPCLVAATRHARLAVVGSRGRGGFRGLLLGSVSQQLLHHSHCPVAVVREATPDAHPAGAAGAPPPAA